MINFNIIHGVYAHAYMQYEMVSYTHRRVFAQIILHKSGWYK